MVEQAFKVLPTATLYQTYFLAEAEKIKFHTLARTFFTKHGFTDDARYSGYYMSENLCMQLSPADREKYASQLKKLVDRNEICHFKKSSKLNKLWQEEVVGLCDMKKLDGAWCWYLPYIGKGKYSLWHDGKDLYGYLMDENKSSFELASWMEPIKMSTYYAIQEAITERNAASE